MYKLKFCVDCKYYKYKFFYIDHHYCKYDGDSSNFDLITGKKFENYFSCISMRASYGECGIEGKLFEPKE